MIYVTSDLHGYDWKKFARLLKGAGFGNDDFLFVLGDVIDRNGDGGIETLRHFMRMPNVQLLRGNHEDMMLKCSFILAEVTDALLSSLTPEDMDALNLWLYNGAQPTINTLNALYREDPDEAFALMDYVREAPLYDSVSLPGGDFILTHAGLGNFEKDKPLSAYSEHDLIWYRPEPAERFHEDIMTVFGHTPTRYYDSPNRAFKTDTWIDIDTGAAAGEGNAPMLLRLDDMQEFYAV